MFLISDGGTKIKKYKYISKNIIKTYVSVEMNSLNFGVINFSKLNSN